MSRPIQVHGDLAIDPARETEAIHYFETTYRPTASRFEGYVDLHLLKLTTAVTGTAPPGVNYRFSITFRSEELRQRWVASPEHQQVWEALDGYLTEHDVAFLLFDVV
jgi:heme-degrading monooxygenase HmoA